MQLLVHNGAGGADWGGAGWPLKNESVAAMAAVWRAMQSRQGLRQWVRLVGVRGFEPPASTSRT
jgi:hypothetical protein